MYFKKGDRVRLITDLDFYDEEFVIYNIKKLHNLHCFDFLYQIKKIDKNGNINSNLCKFLRFILFSYNNLLWIASFKNPKVCFYFYSKTRFFRDFIWDIHLKYVDKIEDCIFEPGHRNYPRKDNWIKENVLVPNSYVIDNRPMCSENACETIEEFLNGNG